MSLPNSTYLLTYSLTPCYKTVSVVFVLVVCGLAVISVVFVLVVSGLAVISVVSVVFVVYGPAVLSVVFVFVVYGLAVISVVSVVFVVHGLAVISVVCCVCSLWFGFHICGVCVCSLWSNCYICGDYVCSLWSNCHICGVYVCSLWSSCHRSQPRGVRPFVKFKNCQRHRSRKRYKSSREAEANAAVQSVSPLPCEIVYCYHRSRKTLCSGPISVCLFLSYITQKF